ncbi:tRNA glutamyl-Q(34) synthetase GluQRS [Magnetospirillum molischianum]|uniref:Putative Glutamyl-tRNA synthetase, class Ic n=1 Tax=Magnetospirillum molischianum DSM 120 TaxID=1150626 RepID=H8FTP8_MAGML|nr:tRNA glutamyl-Q(34) synthetase GluQRS [Magnetospirillum molischianum]CCG41755.1 putative Glutamyl-tRNA synthetase, class Ic [Magnetospirillum molischianum DSM 120]
MIVTRFAPSPTGELHLGHAFSALSAFAAARMAAGRFLLRIEDIDLGRCRPAFVDSILTDLSWLGLVWEEPVRRQSEHFDEYRAALDVLSAQGLLYPCFCTRKDIAGAGQAPHGPDGPLYPGTCRNLSPAEQLELRESGQPFALRLDCAEATRRVGRLVWHDRFAGTVVARPELFGDFVLARKDCPASYHLAVTLDDAHQGVTLVTRGEDLFAATHVHRLLQALFDLPVPDYSHHPLLTGPDGRRLAKRDHAQTLRSLREDGRSAVEVRAMVGLV